MAHKRHEQQTKKLFKLLRVRS